MLAWSRLLCALVCLVAVPGWAATFTVNSTDDVSDASPGDGNCATGRTTPAGAPECTLRAAVEEAAASLSGPNEIVVPAGTYALSLTANCRYFDLGNGFPIDTPARTLCLRGNTTITGAGAAATLIDGMGATRIMFVSAGASVLLRGVTLQNGLHTASGYNGGGGAINNQGTLTVQDSAFTTNASSTGGGGALYSIGALTIRNVTMTGNSQIPNAGDGGAIFLDGGASLDVSNATFTANSAGNGGGAIAVNTSGSATITASTFSGNTASAGGGLRAYKGAVSITNSTFAGNSSSGSGGALRNQEFGTIALRNVTITQNSAGLGGGGGIDGGTNTSMVNTILAGNTNSGNGQPQDCAGSINSLGYNLIGTTTGCTIAGDTTGNVTGVSPQLGALAQNGGATATVALLPSSPAIDAGSPAAPGSGGNGCPAFDQRGILRPQGGGRCDIGAFERNGGFGVTKVTPARGGNAGATLAVVSGTGFAGGATVRLRRSGQPDIVGTPVAVDPGGYSLTTSFDLTGAQLGNWDVEVTNADASVTSLPAGFSVEAPVQGQLWARIVGRSAVRAGVPAKYMVIVGNRGNVDATAVPISLITPGNFELTLNFDVAPPPSQPGQVVTDWTNAPLAVFPYAVDGDLNVPLVLPVIPAGFTANVGFTILLPPDTPHGTEFTLAAPMGDSLLDPASIAVTQQQMVDGAIQYAHDVLGVTVPTQAAGSIQAYAAQQLPLLVASARQGIVASLGDVVPLASLSQLNIDAGYYAASRVNASAASALAAKASSGVRLKDGYVPPCSGQVLAEGQSCRDPKKPAPPPSIFCAPGVLCPGGCAEIPGHHVSNDGSTCVPNPGNKCGLFQNPFSAVSPCSSIPIKNSADPNEKTGPVAGAGNTYLKSLDTLPYQVAFENQPTASGAAQQVVVTDQLDVAKLDLSTFALGPISFGDITVTPSPGLTTFNSVLDLRPTQDILVRIEAGLNAGTGVATWRFTTLDPATGQITTDPDAGFLPPDTAPPNGQGLVMFTIQPKKPVATGTTICNQASIVFDFNAPIATNAFCNTVDDVAPVSHVVPLAAQQPGPSFLVQWVGSDVGSAISSYDVYVADNGGPFTLWQQETTDTQAMFIGQANHSYAFYSLAHDQAGNTEASKVAAEATTLVTQSATYSLSVSATHGIISPNPVAATYAPGALVQLTATPDAGYTFAGWTGDAADAGLVNPTTITMDGNKVVGANFVALGPCDYVLAPTDLHDVAAAGASPVITVTTPAGCTVTASSFQPWVTIGAITPSGATTTVQLQVAANPGAPRATSILLAERLFLVTQSGP